MKPGAQWIVIDVHYFGSPLAVALWDRFGSMGPVLFIAFLCACKRSRTPGQITYMSDVEALQDMGIPARLLVDDDGTPWTLDDFWTLTGRMKNTKRTSRGRVRNVRATHWERWQQNADRVEGREKKRRQRAQNQGDNPGTTLGHVPANVPPDIDRDIDIPPPSSSTSPNGTRHRAVDRGGGDPSTTTTTNSTTAPPRPGPPPTSPADQAAAALAAAVDILAAERLTEVRQAAAAGQRPPVHSERAWLAKTAEEIRIAELGALTEAQNRLPAGTGPDIIVATWRRLPALRADDAITATAARSAELDALSAPGNGTDLIAAARAALHGPAEATT